MRLYIETHPERGRQKEGGRGVLNLYRDRDWFGFIKRKT
jgi:hypothetical protein